MAALQCDICGGKLVGKPGGIFECDSCGMEYSTEWARAKIQEIKGTVKVEGTVEVAGTVKVDGPVEVKGGVNAESLLKRGWMALEDGKWLEAQVAFDQVLNLEPENVRAHLGRYLGVNKIHTMTEAEEQYEEYFYVASREGETCPVCRNGKLAEKEEGLFRCPACGNLFDSRKKIAETRRIRQLADAELKQWFARLDAVTEESIRQRIEEAKREAERKAEEARLQAQRKAEEERLAREERERQDKEILPRLPAVRKKIRYTHGRVLAAGFEHIVGLKPDGTVVAVGKNDDGQCDVSKWRDIVAVSANFDYTLGLKSNGTVVSAGFVASIWDVKKWRNIVSISAGVDHAVGLKADGTVVAVGKNNYGQCDVSGWRNIVAISARNARTVGLKADGTVVFVGSGFGFDSVIDVSDWKEIVAVEATEYDVLGLTAGGTVLYTGRHSGKVEGEGEYIVAIDNHGNCLRSDGTVCGRDENSWHDIIAIDDGIYHSVGLRADGTVVCRDSNQYRAPIFNVSDWILATPDTRIASLNSEKETLSTELSNLRGLFSGRRRREIEARLAEIESELKSLS